MGFDLWPTLYTEPNEEKRLNTLTGSKGVTYENFSRKSELDLLKETRLGIGVGWCTTNNVARKIYSHG